MSFRYDEDRPLIEDLSLVARPGQTVAIVGPTGAGKTTLVNLIMRFYDLDGGRITLDGVDVSTMRRGDLRGRTGMVLQDTWLFEGTIRDNIAYGRPDASEEEIHEAARATFVDRFVHNLPDGYDTVIDEDGANISAGERQLVTIARAFLADPALLILDEATSSVDTRTELLLQHAMAALRTDRTSFVIAHRLSTIRDADLILVMEDGSHRRAGHARRAARGRRRLRRALQLAVLGRAGVGVRFRTGWCPKFTRCLFVLVPSPCWSAAHVSGATLGGCSVHRAAPAARPRSSSVTKPSPTRASSAPPVVPAPFRDPLPGMPAAVPGQVYARAGAGQLAPRAAGDPAYLYVPNAYGAPITTVIDQRTRKIVRVLQTGDLSQHVTPSWDLRTLYVEASASNQLVPLDPATGRIEDASRSAGPTTSTSRPTASTGS